MWPFKNKPIGKKVRLVVTGTASEKSIKKLAESIKEEGVKTVVTDVPVLGVFDI